MGDLCLQGLTVVVNEMMGEPAQSCIRWELGLQWLGMG